MPTSNVKPRSKAALPRVHRDTAPVASRPTRVLNEPGKLFTHDEIVRGITPDQVKRLMESGFLGAKQVYRVVPERTFSRRLAKRERLRASESDAINRLVRVTADAEKTFGNSEFAKKWLNLPNPALADRIPIEMAETDAGAREVEVILTRIAHGVYS